ncbi:hypothetical protein [Dialister invisus]|uniref:hypothetical protein n=1 Tax=Dialister invisus TaxID=218538 RepID=UPI00399BC883
MIRLKKMGYKQVTFCMINILLLLFCGGIVYIIFHGDNYPPSIDLLCENRIRVFSETYALIDTQKNKIITNRVLAAYVIDSKVYALGAGEYIIYDMDIGKEKVYIQDANMKQARNIYRKSFEMAEREYVFSYSEFTEEEQRGFQAMFMNPHKRGAVYYKPFYNSCYKAGLIDTQKLAEVDIIGDDWRIVNDVFYAYGYDSFIIITGHGEKIRQYYNPELTLNKMVIDEDKYHKIDKKKALYGSRYSVLADINEFTPEEIEILHSLWKESFLRRVPEEKEKEQEKEMDRVWHKIRTEE